MPELSAGVLAPQEFETQFSSDQQLDSKRMSERTTAKTTEELDKIRNDQIVSITGTQTPPILHHGVRWRV